MVANARGSGAIPYNAALTAGPMSRTALAEPTLRAPQPHNWKASAST